MDRVIFCRPNLNTLKCTLAPRRLFLTVIPAIIFSNFICKEWASGAKLYLLIQ